MCVNVVVKGLKLHILTDESMVSVLEQNIGNARFIWNNLLLQYNELYRLFKVHDYPLKPNILNFNAMLKLF